MRQAIPNEPRAPFPITVETYVTAGFGRGSAELGIPTANISPELLAELEPGVYFGWACVEETPGGERGKVDTTIGRKVEFNYGSELPAELAGAALPMVMSIGWNPFYNNEKKSAEVHICRKFATQFYGAQIKVVVLGYMRPEQNYESVDALIEDIRRDIAVAQESLAAPAYRAAAPAPAAPARAPAAAPGTRQDARR